MNASIDACLAGVTQCAMDGPCPTMSWPRSCLTARIPAWSATTHRVTCCSRCCLAHWQSRLGLDLNAQHWKTRGLDSTISSGTGGIEAAAAGTVHADVERSILFFRYSMARFAHIQAIALSDWTALVAKDADVRSPRFSTPSAASAKEALVCLNGFGHILNARRTPLLNATASGSAMDDGAIVHATAPPAGGSRVIFLDPLPKVVGQGLRQGGHHAVLYGDDKSLSAALLERYRAFTGLESLARFYAPNLSPQAARLPFATSVPLGLNHNARHLATPASLDGGLLDPVSGSIGRRQARTRGRKSTLLCCCQRPYDFRLAIASQLTRAGFNCTSLLHGSDATRSFAETLELYSRHRFVLALHGRGHQDFRLWEIMLAGAIPVLERFEEHDSLLDGLPVVRVANWSDLTPALLHAEWARIQRGVATGELSWTKLYLPYWFHTFTAHMQPSML